MATVSLGEIQTAGEVWVHPLLDKILVPESLFAQSEARWAQNQALCPGHEALRAKQHLEASVNARRKNARVAEGVSNSQMLAKLRRALGTGDSRPIAPMWALDNATILACARYAVRQQL